MTNSTSESSTPADPYGDLIRRARELEERATPGPWEYNNQRIYDDNRDNIVWPMYLDCDISMRTFDGEFIAASRQLVPDLANALEAVLAENAQLKAWLATIARVFNPKPPEDEE